MGEGCEGNSKSKEQAGFIEGNLTHLHRQDIEEVNAWDMVNFMLCSWLRDIIYPKQRMNVAYLEMAYAM